MTIPVPARTLAAFPLRRTDSAPRGAYLLFGGLLAVIAVLALLPGLIGPSLDAAVFSVVGERVAHGALPYADIFDHKPPALYLMIALGQVLGGSIGTWKVSWILSVGSVALSGVVVADTLRRTGWRWTAWVAGALCAVELASFPLALGGGLSETACVLPAAVALRLVVVGRPTPLRRLGAGLLVGLATAISLQAAPAALAILAASAIRADGDGHRLRSRLVGLTWIASGVATVWAGLLVFLGTSGATLAAFRAIVGYNSVYQQLASLDDPMAGEAVHALLILAPLVIPALVGVLLTFRQPRSRAVEVGALVWLAASVAFIVYQGRLEVHYTALLVVPLALLVPAGLSSLRLRGSLRGLMPRAALMGILLSAVMLSGLLIAVETTMAMRIRSVQAERNTAVATWVDDNVATSGSVFVWGNTPELYLDIPRAPASAYVYLLPLTTPGWVSTSTIDKVRDEFMAHPPSVIIDAGSSAPGVTGLPPLLIQRPVAAGDGRDEDLLSPLRNFVAQNYRLGAIVHGWPIYVLR